MKNVINFSVYLASTYIATLATLNIEYTHVTNTVLKTLLTSISVILAVQNPSFGLYGVGAGSKLPHCTHILLWHTLLARGCGQGRGRETNVEGERRGEKRG